MNIQPPHTTIDSSIYCIEMRLNALLIGKKKIIHVNSVIVKKYCWLATPNISFYKKLIEYPS